ncbi:hypothetical protein OGAPHI_002624 [Ogataea philodendri]|uniref:Ankyrin repeat-containing protein n=1 Tax=Ogataea philodendri TaxID=1378263 RepID=A0A9P8T7V9_9ASCO|nr:uncharacterized protein OGAPHI_002624 [Ogataea philodendri]KAH3668869.1 hypothetical protein OGAPHI_002624 [Ogataea philodendri]
MSNIWIAASDNNVDLVKQFLASGDFSANSKDPNGYTPIHAAVSYGNLDLLRYLISQGGDINVQDSDGDTPLHHAESVEVAKVLVEELNADYKLKNNDGLTPAKYQEEEQEFPELIEYLSSLEKLGPVSSMKTGSSMFDENLQLPNGEKVKMFLAKDSDEALNQDLIQRRQEIEQIMNQDITEEQKDEQLKNLILNVVSDNFQQLKEPEAPDSKRQK